MGAIAGVSTRARRRMGRAAAVLSAATLVMAAATARAEPMVFGDACVSGPRVTIAAVGDLLFHNRLQRFALNGGRGYRGFWAPVQSVLSGADIAYGNLEGPAAPGVAAGGREVRDPGRVVDRVVYGYRPPFLAFNFHPSVVGELAESGFDVISTANNHSLDRGAIGIDRTIDAFDAASLSFTGTRRLADARAARGAPEPRVVFDAAAPGTTSLDTSLGTSVADARAEIAALDADGAAPAAPPAAFDWTARTEANGVTVAWLACTDATNGWPNRDEQVLMCQSPETLATIRRAAADPSVDAVIVTPHWGWEYNHRPHPSQQRFARSFIDAGATAVLGAHPHVLQPWERRETADGRVGLIVYSMGNFISNQRRPNQRTGAIVLLELTRGAPGRATLTAAGYVPTWVDITHNNNVVTPAAPSSWAGRHARDIYPAGNAVSAARFRALPRPECAPSNG